MEKQAQDYILENIRNAINTKRNIISKLYDLIETKQELKVREFFESYHVTPSDVYSKKVTVVGLAAQAGLLKGYQVDDVRERLLASALGRLSSLNSRRWIKFMQKILPQILLGKGSLGPSLTSGERTIIWLSYLVKARWMTFQKSYQAMMPMGLYIDLRFPGFSVWKAEEMEGGYQFEILVKPEENQAVAIEHLHQKY